MNTIDPQESYTAAQKLIEDLVSKMSKPEDDEEDQNKAVVTEDEEAPEIPPYPITVVATHGDLKRAKKVPKTIVSNELGQELAQSVGGQFFQVNANGKNVRKALESVVSAIHTVESNLIFDRHPTRCERIHASIRRCTVM